MWGYDENFSWNWLFPHGLTFLKGLSKSKDGSWLELTVVGSLRTK